MIGRRGLAVAGLAGIALLGAAGIGALVFSRSHTSPLVSGTDHAAAARPPSAPRLAATTATGQPASRTEAYEGEIAGGEEATRALAEALLPHIGRQGAARDALRAARAGEIDAVDLGLKLHDAIVGHPEVALDLVPELCAERRSDLALKIAQSLALAEDDAGVRRATCDALSKADPEARAVGLLALLGRGEPEAVGLAVRSFVDDSPAARATAGFLLNQAPGGVPAADEGRVLDAARAAVRDTARADRVCEEALGLLGRPGLSDADLELLEQTFLTGPEPGVRGRAFRAIAESGAPLSSVRPTLERGLALPDLPDEIKSAVRAYIAAGGGAR